MLKRYYTVLEAANFLSSLGDAKFSERDLLEIAWRGQLRLCFWVDDALSVLNIQDFQYASLETNGWSKYTYLFKGYLQVPIDEIKPNASSFTVSFFRNIVEVVSAHGFWHDRQCSEPVPTLQNLVSEVNCYAVQFNGRPKASFALFRETPQTTSPKVFRLTLPDVLVPAVDLLHLTDQKIQGEGNSERGAVWPVHETEKLRALRMAAVRFWSRYDPNDPTTAHKNEEVSEWLQKEYKGLIGATLADAMATILRADGLKFGPKKKS